jgi:hypothetical protein
MNMFTPILVHYVEWKHMKQTGMSSTSFIENGYLAAKQVLKVGGQFNGS